MTSATDLAALLCSRLCHDMLSPVGALSNGLELLADEKDPEMRKRCFELLEQSAKISTDKLKFFRLAYGAAGGFGDEVPSDEPRGLVAGLIAANERVDVRMGRRRCHPAQARGQGAAQPFGDRDRRARARRHAAVGAERRDGATEIAVRAAGPRVAFDGNIGKALDGSLAARRADRPDRARAHDPPARRRVRRRPAVRAERRALVMGAVLPDRGRLMDPELVHRELPSPNWDERALPVTMVVLHYTEMEARGRAASG